MTNRFAVIGILMVTLAAARPSSANECFEGELCERLNGDVDVFVGRILTEIDDDGAVRVHVVRSFKGSAKDDIPVVVIPIGLLGLPSYEIRYPVRKPRAECATGPRSSQIANALIATIAAIKIRT